MFSDLLEDYLQDNTTEIPDYLIDLEKTTFLKALKPQMLSGRIQGRFLSLLSRLKAPSRILEIGTYTGYSALCLAEGLTNDGKLITLEVNDEIEHIYQAFFSRSPYKDQIEVMIGDAEDTIQQRLSHHDKFDIVFIDANKKNYPRYLELCYPLLRDGGLLIADNVLWYEKVVNATINDTETQALREFNQLVKDHNSLHSFILPLRDGLTLAQKKEA